MSFVSIIFDEQIGYNRDLPIKQPEHFNDLYLDQIINDVTSGWDEYNLKPFYYFPLKNEDEIYYRHNIFRDLEDENIYEKVSLFSDKMRKVRGYLKQVEKFYYEEQKEIWFLYSAEIYCDAVKIFIEELESLSIKSEGFRKFRDYLKEYYSGDRFKTLSKEIKIIKELSC